MTWSQELWLELASPRSGVGFKPIKCDWGSQDPDTAGFITAEELTPARSFSCVEILEIVTRVHTALTGSWAIIIQTVFKTFPACIKQWPVSIPAPAHAALSSLLLWTQDLIPGWRCFETLWWWNSLRFLSSIITAHAYPTCWHILASDWSGVIMWLHCLSLAPSSLSCHVIG